MTIVLIVVAAGLILAAIALICIEDRENHRDKLLAACGLLMGGITIGCLDVGPRHFAFACLVVIGVSFGLLATWVVNFGRPRHAICKALHIGKDAP